MKSAPLLLVASSVLSLAGAVSLRERPRDAAPRVVRLDLERNTVRDPVAHDRERLRRRSGTVQATLSNQETLYFLNASMGTPPQNVRLHVDTGSSDLWINTPKSSLCTMRGDPCAESGTFVANDSSTYHYVNGDFNISYADGSGASGDYATDTMHISGQTVADLQFGIGYVSSSTQSILGIGYAGIEAQVVSFGDRPYLNLPAKMKDQGLIASNAYSLWLNDLDSNTGSLLFGGIDTEQFEGTLVSVPILQVGGEFAEFFITMTGLSTNSTDVAGDLSVAVLLDSGSSLTYIPNELAASVYDQVNAVFQEDQGVAFVPCDVATRDISITFKFSDPASITVPIDELVLDITDENGRTLTFNNGDDACLFGIVPSGGSSNVLGDTFLRSAYVVYDLDNNEISLAQSNFNATKTHVEEIGTGSDAVPSATGATAAAGKPSGVPADAGPGRDDSNAAAAVSPLSSETVSVGVAALLIGFAALLI